MSPKKDYNPNAHLQNLMDYNPYALRVGRLRVKPMWVRIIILMVGMKEKSKGWKIQSKVSVKVG